MGAEECYICTESEPAPFRSACLCKDRFLHAHCLRQLIATQGHSNCSVCKAPFENVRTKARYTCSAACVALWLLLLLNLTLAACAVRVAFAVRTAPLMIAVSFFWFCFLFGSTVWCWYVCTRGLHVLALVQTSNRRVVMV